jgi:hypothetical protein
MVEARPLGHVAAPIVARVVEVRTDELDGAPTARCTAGPLTRCPGGQLGVPVAGLDELADVVFDVTAPVGPVTPAAVPGRRRARLGHGAQGARWRPLHPAWRAWEVVLVAGRSSARGPRFEDVARFPLGT